jgi:hypothetical protein
VLGIHSDCLHETFSHAKLVARGESHGVSQRSTHLSTRMSRLTETLAGSCFSPQNTIPSNYFDTGALFIALVCHMLVHQPGWRGFTPQP